MKLVEAKELVVGNEYIIVFDNEEILRDKIETVRHVFSHRGSGNREREVKNYQKAGEVAEVKPALPQWAEYVNINISFMKNPLHLPMFGSRKFGFNSRLKIYEVPVVLNQREEDAQTIAILKAQLEELKEINAKLLGGKY